MKQLYPYVNFDGRCKEAMAMYQSVLGGELTTILVHETPMAEHFTADQQHQVMHSTLIGNGFTIAGGDFSPESNPFTGGCVIIDCETEAEINRLYEAFASKGTVLCPLGPAFWGAIFGCVQDQYGVRWSMNFATTG